MVTGNSRICSLLLIIPIIRNIPIIRTMIEEVEAIIVEILRILTGETIEAETIGVGQMIEQDLMAMIGMIVGEDTDNM